MIKHILKFKDKDYKDAVFSLIPPNEDVAIETLTEVLIENYWFMKGGVINSDIEEIFNNGINYLGGNSTIIKKYDDNWYGMKFIPWNPESAYFLITKKNFIEVFKKWQKYMEEKPNYIIITRDENHYSIKSADNIEDIASDSN